MARPSFFILDEVVWSKWKGSDVFGSFTCGQSGSCAAYPSSLCVFSSFL